MDITGATITLHKEKATLLQIGDQKVLIYRARGDKGNKGGVFIVADPGVIILNPNRAAEVLNDKEQLYV